jgi:uncharacterized protein (TIGR03435 family)
MRVQSHARLGRYALAAFGSVVILASTIAARAQAPSPTPPVERRFVVASVKPNRVNIEDLPVAERFEALSEMLSGNIRTSGGRFTAFRATLRELVLHAFELREYQLEGGPRWFASDLFDIDARAEGDVTPAESNAMLRQLLTERFGLRTHVETRQIRVQVLTVARPDGRLGPTLTTTPPACVAEIEERARTGAQTPSLSRPRSASEARETRTTERCGRTSWSTDSRGGTTVRASGSSMQDIVGIVSRELNAPVVDRTGLTGMLDFTMGFTPARRADPSIESAFSPIQGALQQQLGLKLETEPGPGTVLVVDRAEQPTPN